MGMPFRGGMLFKPQVQPKIEVTDMAYRPKEPSDEYGRQKVAILRGGKVLKPLHFSK
jgi:hypothetical protein